MLQFLTGNIGLQHVHHLSARIPNYNLQAAHDENAALNGVPTISRLDGLRATRLKFGTNGSGSSLASAPPAPRVSHYLRRRGAAGFAR